MKKLISVVLIFAFLMAMTTIAMAAPVPKIAAVSVSGSAVEVKVNETVYLTAITSKQGSSYLDNWSGASKVSTIFNNGQYTSTATFNSSVPGIYELSYDIIMSAGKSDVTFEGSKKIIIKVVKPEVVTGAIVKNVKFTDVVQNVGKDDTPKIVGVEAVGDVYAVWSDGSQTFTGITAKAYFGNGQSSGSKKSIAVVFELGGVTYNNYTVTFIKP